MIFEKYSYGNSGITTVLYRNSQSKNINTYLSNTTEYIFCANFLNTNHQNIHIVIDMQSQRNESNTTCTLVNTSYSVIEVQMHPV